LNSLGLPYYLLPLHKRHFSIGVTETPFSGDATDVTSTDDEVNFLLEETNRILPGLNLCRADVLRSWAGVRPLTNSTTDPMGNRNRKLHDLAERGMPGVYAMTSGPIITHRESGRLVKEVVASGLSPSRAKGQIDTTPYAFSKGDNSSAFTEDEPDIREIDLELGVTRERARTLADVLVRRTGMAWRRDLTRDEVERAARIVGPHLNWSSQEEAAHVSDFLSFQSKNFRRPERVSSPDGAPNSDVQPMSGQSEATRAIPG